MQVRREEFTLDTLGDGEIHDVTAEAQKAIANSGLRDGIWFDVHLSAVGKEKPALAPILELLKGFSLR